MLRLRFRFCRFWPQGKYEPLSALLPKETKWIISNKSRDHVLFINTYVMCTGDYLLAMFAIHDCKFSRLYMPYIYNVPRNRDQLMHNMCYSHFLNKNFHKLFTRDTLRVKTCLGGVEIENLKLTVIIFGTIDTCFNRNFISRIIFEKYFRPFWLCR